MAKHPRTRSSPVLRSRKHVAIFPGSFDPVTFGHLDVIRRGRQIFDELVVAVGHNPSKDELFTLEERVALVQGEVRAIAAAEAGASVRVEGFSGLTVDFARHAGATVLLRGIRNLSDLQNEVQQALTNREIAGIETAFVVAGQNFSYTSSSLIKQLTALGHDLRALRTMVPPSVVRALRAKKASGHPALGRILAARDGAVEG